MSAKSHLWAIGFDTVERAEQVRKEIADLGWGAGKAGKYLLLLDAVLVVRNSDGSFTINREPFPAVANVVGCTLLGFLAGLVLATPVTGATVGAVLSGAGTAVKALSVGIQDEFIRDVEAMMKPGTSALFVLDDEGDLDEILDRIKGLGGTVLKTNVDSERAKLIQATLAGPKA